jgi:hypothetical protein
VCKKAVSERRAHTTSQSVPSEFKDIAKNSVAAVFAACNGCRSTEKGGEYRCDDDASHASHASQACLMRLVRLVRLVRLMRLF